MSYMDVKDIPIGPRARLVPLVERPLTVDVLFKSLLRRDSLPELSKEKSYREKGGNKLNIGRVRGTGDAGRMGCQARHLPFWDALAMIGRVSYWGGFGETLGRQVRMV